MANKASPAPINKIAAIFWIITAFEISSFKSRGNLKEKKAAKISKKTYWIPWRALIKAIYANGARDTAQFCRIDAPAPTDWFARKITPVFLEDFSFGFKITSLISGKIIKKHRAASVPPKLFKMNPVQKGAAKKRYFRKTNDKDKRNA